MEPFLAIGGLLQEKGHRVICAFPEQFRDLSEGAGLAFASLGSKFIEMLDSEDGKAALGGGSSGLLDFLARHQETKVLFITFGSMLNPVPHEKTRVITQVLESQHIPAVINTAAGGLVKPDQFDAGLLHFVSRVPYDWIFPKVYGVVHHGGSGTTHLALRYGCPSLLVPHIIDQFVRNDLVYDLSVGPKGLKIDKLNVDALGPKILDLVSNPTYKNRAEAVSAQMEKEDLTEAVTQAVIGEGALGLEGAA